MIGIAIGVAWAVSEWAGPQRTPRRAAAVAAAALLVALAFLTIRQIGYWHDNATLFEHGVAVNDSDYMQANLATTLMGQRRDAEAEPHLRAGVRLAPDGGGDPPGTAVFLL